MTSEISERLCLLSILFLKEKIDQMRVTTTYFGNKMILEGVKGCQWAFLYGWIPILTTFLQLQISPWSCATKWTFFALRRRGSFFASEFEKNSLNEIFSASPARKLIRRRRAKKFRFFAPLHNDIWSWRKIANTEAQLWLITYWQSLTISNLILSPNYVVVWPTWSIFSFNNKMGSKHNLSASQIPSAQS